MCLGLISEDYNITPPLAYNNPSKYLAMQFTWIEIWQDHYNRNVSMYSLIYMGCNLATVFL